MKPAVARAALAAGASIVNDVAANRDDDAMWRGRGGVSRRLRLHARAGHAADHAGKSGLCRRGPRGRRIFSGTAGTIERLGGVAADQVVLDAGIGFGKTLEHNLQLLANLRSFTKWRRPLLLGVSRKSFIGKLLGAD